MDDINCIPISLQHAATFLPASLSGDYAIIIAYTDNVASYKITITWWLVCTATFYQQKGPINSGFREKQQLLRMISLIDTLIAFLWRILFIQQMYLCVCVYGMSASSSTARLVYLFCLMRFRSILLHFLLLLFNLSKDDHKMLKIYLTYFFFACRWLDNIKSFEINK